MYSTIFYGTRRRFKAKSRLLVALALSYKEKSIYLHVHVYLDHGSMFSRRTCGDAAVVAFLWHSGHFISELCIGVVRRQPQ
jgi:hypothetical protein